MVDFSIMFKSFKMLFSNENEKKNENENIIIKKKI